MVVETKPPGDGRSKRRRRVYACDSCYKKKIKCDGASPKCDWCRHHDIACVYTRNQDSTHTLPSQPARTPNEGSPSVSGTSTPRDHDSRHSKSDGSPYPTPGPQPVAPVGFGSNMCFAGQSLGSIGGFNGLPVFSEGGIEWIKQRTGEDVSLDQYRTGALGYAASHPVDVPSEEPPILPELYTLRALVAKFKTSIYFQMFPVINSTCFDYTILAAYGNEVSDISPCIPSAKACVFGFMALTSFLAGSSQEGAIMNMDKYCRAAQDLLPEVYQSVTLDGLQAILMLCFCFQAISADILKVELHLSSAARYIFHLKGNMYPKSRQGDVLGMSTHVRNLFWTAYLLDKIMTLRMGLQPIFDPPNCDLTLPELRQADGKSNTDNRAFHTFIRLCIVQADIYRNLYSISAMQKSDADLLGSIRTLDTMLEEWHSSVPTFSRDPDSEETMADFLFEMQYHYCMSAIHQTSSRCRAWALNQDTRAAGSSLAISIASSRSLLFKFLDAKPHLMGHYLMFCLPELTVSAIHLFSSILMCPLDTRSEQDLNLMRRTLTHVEKHLWQQAPASFTSQVRLAERFMGDLQRLAECAVRKANREKWDSSDVVMYAL
ncbi:hypothetical protein BJY04DRAFT_209408 [Aspergillus karnatakaensis]|uniref:Zn(II)2Cys6 transcription factor n=1 Tax=Aspergillus karnatakaensis TaxID=1810916 RepID=UPI003CCCE80F